MAGNVPPLPQDAVQPATRAAWRAWLARNHGRGRGIWLVTLRKASGKPRITYEDAVEEALCFGWIDSKPRALDAARTMLWFAPRKPGSGWSRPNKLRIARLVELGRMSAPGSAVVEAAKRDGSWSKLDDVEDLVVPPDLADALRRHRGAAAHFAAFPKSARRGILEWIANAKLAATRARRVEETARLAALNQRANQWRPKA